MLATFLFALSAPSVALVLSASPLTVVLSAPSTFAQGATADKSVALLWSGSAAAQAAAPKKTVDIVSVTGCLREQGPNWMLVAATEPAPSIANQASGADIPATPPAGKHTFRLIGVSEFNFPQMRDKTVVIRGLFIKDKVSRINVTSAVEAVATCTPGAPK